jgi:hypothetical protein
MPGRVRQTIQVFHALTRRSQEECAIPTEDQTVDLLQVSLLQATLILYLPHQLYDGRFSFTNDPNVKDLFNLYSALCGKGTVRQWLRSLSPINQNGRLA